MAKQLKVEQSGDRQQNQIQTIIAAGTQQLRDGPFGDGLLLEGITFVDAVPKKVNTLLGRAPRGWVLCRFQSVTSGGSLVETAGDDSSFTFLSFGASTASIWVF